MPIDVTGGLAIGPEGEDEVGLIESPFMAVDPGPTQHHLDQGPEHLRSTPNVHEQAEVENPDAKAAAERPAREIIIQHLAACALDPQSLPAVELACEVRKQLLGRVEAEGCPGWALKLPRMGGPAAAHHLPDDRGAALQEIAAVFAEAMQLAVDRAREESEEQRQRDENLVLEVLGARAPFAVQIGTRVTTLSGLSGLVTDVGIGGAFTASLVTASADEVFAYTPTGCPVIEAHHLYGVLDRFPLAERLRLTIASIQPPKEY